ncbi:TniQ family protein [Shewanella sp. 3B26]|uniref:TniQ family protein n=1 Tax=Shewanella zhuhaiensis TaxID=2919576 RepID=A0AAJ1F1F5_9GAMM|nr:TniQ family protein [Shewanella zhuhaiensis]MCH4296121.1 TniQ family protein [Shewanella zhuhaiensis]
MSDNFKKTVRDQLRRFQGNDESIHSFLLRTQLYHVPEAKPVGVIAKNGNWVKDPYANNELRYLFYSFSDHQLLEAIDISKSIDGLGNWLFDSPDRYVSALKSTFFHTRDKVAVSKHSNRIRYCLHCIREGIEQLGYGYFRHFWGVSNYCLIHDTPLRELPELGFSQSVKAVKNILRGKDIPTAKQLSRSSQSTLEMEDTKIRRKYFFPLKSAVCLQIPLAFWVYKNASRIKNSDVRSSVLIDGLYLVENVTRLHKLELQQSLTALLIIMSSLEPELLREFYLEHVDFIGLELGPRKQGILKEVYSKKKGADCNSCQSKICVMKEKISTFKVSLSELSLAYMFQNSYTLTRVALQGRPINLLANDAWSPMELHLARWQADSA